MLAFIASWFTPPVLFCVLNLTIGTILITSNSKTHNKPPPPAAEADEHYNPPQLLRAPSFLQRVRSFNLSLYRSDDPLQFETHHHVDPPQQRQPEDEHNNPPQLVRAPSFLQRVRSFNLSLYRSEQPDDPLRFETHHHLVDPPQQQPEDDEDEDEPNHPPQLVRTPSFLERVRSFNFSLYRSEQPDPSQPKTHHHHVEESQSHVTRSKSDTTGEGPPPARMRKSASERTRAEEEAEEEVDQRRPATARDRNTTPLFGEDEEEVDAKADDFINRFKQQLKLQRLDSILRYREMLNRGSGR